MSDGTGGKKGVEAEREPNFLAIATAAIGLGLGLSPYMLRELAREEPSAPRR